MVAPVELERLAGGRFRALCGGCLKVGDIDATGVEDAWSGLLALGWTAYQYREGSRVYPKCSSCSAAIPRQVPRRGKRSRR